MEHLFGDAESESPKALLGMLEDYVAKNPKAAEAAASLKAIVEPPNPKVPPKPPLPSERLQRADTALRKPEKELSRALEDSAQLRTKLEKLEAQVDKCVLAVEKCQLGKTVAAEALAATVVAPLA